MKCLIIFHSNYGQTRKIACQIGNILESNHLEVELHSVGELDAQISLAPYDLVVIGAPIYASKYSKEILHFVREHLSDLDTKTTTFFSVSLSAAGDSTQKQDADRCLDEFLSKTGWSPTIKQSFAGGLPYTKYNWLTRWMMKRIVRKAGGDIDSSQDYEYTDWDQIEQFALSVWERAKRQSGESELDSGSAAESSARLQSR